MIPERHDENMTNKEEKASRSRKKILIGLLIAAAIVAGSVSISRDFMTFSFGFETALTEPVGGRKLQQASGPKLVWFFTYPEAGATYVLHLLHEITGLATATNYGTVMMDTAGKIYQPNDDSIPVYLDRVGPHYNALLPPPDTYVVTRTHSYGTCFDCAPWKYLGPTAKLRHMKINSYASKIVGGIPSTNKYTMDNVAKMLVMYRDPMDLAVARFNHRVNKWKMLGDAESIAKYTNDHDGYRRYCKDQDASQWADTEKNWYEHGEFWDEAHTLPCRAEFVKIFEFYNMAERVRNFHGLPTMRVRLNDFARNLGETAGKVLEFIEQPYQGLPDENKLGQGEGQFFYFYTNEERKMVARLAKKMCDTIVWDDGFGPLLTKYLL